MIKITPDAFHDKISVENDEIILNGPPADLQGHILFKNQQNDSLKVKALALVDKNKKQIKGRGSSSLMLFCRLQPGEEKLESIRHELPSTTPPGTYESYLLAGGTMRKIKMVVQPTIEIDIYPSHFTFQNCAPGTDHAAVVTLTNLGNMPFQVPEIKHTTTLDMDMFCRALGFGFREKEVDGFVQSLDEVARNLKANLTDYAAISVKERGKVVKPGENMLLHVNITLPRNADPKRDYTGNLRFWNKNISFIIKSHTEKKKEAGHGKEK